MNPAHKIIAKFGGARPLARAVGRSYVSVYKWTYPKSRGGTEGFIPSSAIRDILEAAEELGITLTPEDWTPHA